MICVRFDEAGLRALLAVVPTCSGCSAPATHQLKTSGGPFRVCEACASHAPEGRLELLEHGNAVNAIHEALLESAGV